ncbi:hypothetical protein CR970_02655 [Candidatus Saccharibacteria bacterium]|nr:MAG: hypothetical protein CR970_02655 [Candidatus Saccharibacteria bacterium]
MRFHVTLDPGLGRCTYWAIWPLLAAYMPLTRRSRIILLHDEQVLLVRGWLSSGKLELPGGGVHFGEDPRSGALRELAEEVSLWLAPSDLVLLAHGRAPGAFRYTYDLYLVYLSEYPQVRPQPPEVLHAQWLHVDDLLHSQQVDTATRYLVQQHRALLH